MRWSLSTALFPPTPALSIGLALLLAASPGEAGERQEPPPAFTAAMEEMVHVDGAPGVAALVYQDGRLLYAAQAGVIDPDDPLLVASSSKWVAAALIMTFVDDGDLALDEPIGRHMPELGQPAANITLRQLLSFTSGHAGLERPSDLRQSPCISLTESVRQIASEPLEDMPGSTFRYGSGALQIAGALAERVAQKSWAELFEQRLAGPLAMRSSRWTHPVGRARCQVTNPNLQSGLVTTIEDYGRFLTMIASGGIFEGRRILSRRTVDEMTRLQTGSAELVMPAGRAAENVAGYGLGAWCERALPDGRCTLLSSPGALGAYPWIDRESGAYGVFFMQRRFPYVARSLTEAREAAIAAVAQHYDSTPSDHPPDADRTQAGRLISQRAEK